MCRLITDKKPWGMCVVLGRLVRVFPLGGMTSHPSFLVDDFVRESIGSKVIIWENFLNDTTVFSIRCDMDVKAFSSKVKFSLTTITIS